MNESGVIGRICSVQNRKNRETARQVLCERRTLTGKAVLCSVGRTGMLPCFRVSPKTRSVSTDIVV